MGIKRGIKGAGKWLAFLLLPLLPLAAALALLWFYTMPLVLWASANFLESYGLELRRLEGPALRLDGLEIAGLTLAGDGMTLEADGVSVAFTLAGLLGPDDRDAMRAAYRVEKIDIVDLRVILPAVEAGGGSAAIDVAAALRTLPQTLGALPVGALRLNNFRLTAGANEFLGGMLARTSPLAAELRMASPWPLLLNLESPAPNRFSGSLSGPREVQVEFDAGVAGNDLRGTATLRVAETASANAEFLHRFDGGAGFADIEVPEFNLSGEMPLSALLSLEPPQGDVVAGGISGVGVIEWDGDDVAGVMSLRLEDLSGFIAETAFIDLDTELEFELAPAFGLRSAGPLEASLARVDPGLPLEDLRWNYQFDSARGVLEISQLQAALLGGTVELPSLRLDRAQLESARLSSTLNLILNNVDLAEVTGLANYDELAVTGRISGYLPVRVAPDGLRVEDGLLGALRPGGTIRYTPREPASDPGMQTVYELLSDYHFETLSSHVRLDESGDLLLQTEISGFNPAVNPDQPINLNVNIEDNIPQLLRSLRAGREISRILEEQLNR